MTRKRYVIVNADDFGQSSGINRGIVTAHGKGIVTSASLMVRWPAAAEAAAYGRAHPKLSVGLHIDLGEWAHRDGTCVPLYEVVEVGDSVAVADEVGRQLGIFRHLVGKDPTHIDSHQHVHLREPVRSVLLDVARELAVPLRHCSPEVAYCGAFYGQTENGVSLPGRISVEAMIGLLSALPAGFTELGCHPGEGSDLETMYRVERAQEVRVLCDPRVNAAMAALGIELRSFGELGSSAVGTQGGKG